MSRYIPIGTVTKAAGLDGTVKAAVYGDLLVAVDLPCNVYLVRQQFSHKLATLESLPSGAAEHRIVRRRPAGKGDILRLSLAGIEDRSAAEELAGLEIYLDEELCPPAEEGEFYSWQLIGLPVFLTGSAPGAEPVASVSGVLHYGSRPNLKLILPGGKTCQLPLVDQYVTKIDLEDRRIEVDHLDSFLS